MEREEQRVKEKTNYSITVSQMCLIPPFDRLRTRTRGQELSGHFLGGEHFFIIPCKFLHLFHMV